MRAHSHQRLFYRPSWPHTHLRVGPWVGPTACRAQGLSRSSLHQMIPTARSTAAWVKLHLQVCLPLSPPLLHLDLLLPPPLLRLRLPLGHPLHLLGVDDFMALL